MHANFLQSENPYHLAAPPAWWLQMLHDQDALLVVFPSRMRMAYILARRRVHSNAMAEMDTLDKNLVKQSAGMDGDVMATNNLIYVRHLIGNTVRRPEIFQWLKDHDITANGGAEKVDNRIVSIEEDIVLRKRKQMEDDIDTRAKDAYRSYQARTGQRVGATGSGAKFRPSAVQMPVKGFTTGESSVSMFVR